MANSSRILRGSRLSMPVLTDLPQMTSSQRNMFTVQCQALKAAYCTLCFAAIPQAGASLQDPRQPPAGSKGSNAAADAGTPTCHAVSQETMYHKPVQLSIPNLHPVSAACHIACQCIGVHAFFVLMTSSHLHGQHCEAVNIA